MDLSGFCEVSINVETVESSMRKMPSREQEVLLSEPKASVEIYARRSEAVWPEKSDGS